MLPKHETFPPPESRTPQSMQVCDEPASIPETFEVLKLDVGDAAKADCAGVARGVVVASPN